MKPVARDELLDLGAYERIRDSFLRSVLERKRVRYVKLGPNMTALFENRDTVLFQVQEMLRTERITQEKAIAHELETYNALVPGDRELSVTLFVEYQDRDERERMLVALAQELGTELIAKGVDCEEEARAVLDCGVFYGQGFVLGEPAPLPAISTWPRRG